MIRTTAKCKDVENPRVDAFLNEIKQVCLRHSMTIEHEDGHGAFVIEICKGDEDLDWLMAADIGHSFDGPDSYDSHTVKRGK
jgi:hypothetical protein